MCVSSADADTYAGISFSLCSDAFSARTIIYGRVMNEDSLVRRVRYRILLKVEDKLRNEWEHPLCAPLYPYNSFMYRLWWQEVEYDPVHLATGSLVNAMRLYRMEERYGLRRTNV